MSQYTQYYLVLDLHSTNADYTQQNKFITLLRTLEQCIITTINKQCVYQSFHTLFNILTHSTHNSKLNWLYNNDCIVQHNTLPSISTVKQSVQQYINDMIQNINLQQPETNYNYIQHILQQLHLQYRATESYYKQHNSTAKPTGYKVVWIVNELYDKLIHNLIDNKALIDTLHNIQIDIVQLSLYPITEQIQHNKTVRQQLLHNSDINKIQLVIQNSDIYTVEQLFNCMLDTTLQPCKVQFSSAQSLQIWLQPTTRIQPKLQATLISKCHANNVVLPRKDVYTAAQSELFDNDNALYCQRTKSEINDWNTAIQYDYLVAQPKLSSSIETVQLVDDTLQLHDIKQLKAVKLVSATVLQQYPQIVQQVCILVIVRSFLVVTNISLL